MKILIIFYYFFFSLSHNYICRLQHGEYFTLFCKFKNLTSETHWSIGLEVIMKPPLSYEL